VTDESNLKLTINFTDPDLDEEEKDKASQRLLSQLQDLDEVEEVKRVIDLNPPDGNKSIGGFLAGALRAEVKPSNVRPLFGFLSDRFNSNPLEIEAEFEGRKLKIKVNNQEELIGALQMLQKFMVDKPVVDKPSASQTYNLLILTANPKGTAQLRLDQEVRDIEEGLKRSQHRDQFVLKQAWAVRPRDIQRTMLDNNPQIVHFSGHGGGESGLVFENEIGKPQFITAGALASLFELFADQVNCVVLNGCYSEVQADAIAQHINYVIGMNQSIGDRAAIEFAVGFYDALGAGRSVEFAFRLGCTAIQMAGMGEHLTPVLKKKVILSNFGES
jgi:hypothetical protein